MFSLATHQVDISIHLSLFSHWQFRPQQRTYEVWLLMPMTQCLLGGGSWCAGKKHRSPLSSCVCPPPFQQSLMDQIDNGHSITKSPIWVRAAVLHKSGRGVGLDCAGLNVSIPPSDPTCLCFKGWGTIHSQ